MNYRFQAIQDHYKSFNESLHSNLSRFQSNLTNNSHVPYYGNGSIVPTNNLLDTPAQSSAICIPRNDTLSFPAKTIGNPPQKFSSLEDTFGSVRCHGESYIQNNPVFDCQPGPSRRPEVSLNPSGLQSSFLKSRNNLNSFQSNNSIHNGLNETGVCLRPNETIDDKFSCVRVVSAKALVHNQVPVTLPTVNEAEEEKEEEHDETNTKNSSPQNNEFVLKNWTVVLKDTSLYLMGTKIFGDKIVEKTHTSEKVLFRTRDGKVKTENAFYKLEDPFVLNDEMPLKVKNYFKKNKFPLTWRNVLKTWINESKDENEPIVKNKIKPCQVVLEENDVAKHLKHLAEENKSKIQNKDDKKNVAKKAPARENKNNKVNSVKSSKIMKTKKILRRSSESGAIKKKSQKTSQPKSKLKSQVNKKESAHSKSNVKAKRNENSETRLKQNDEENNETQESDEIDDSVTDVTNVYQDLSKESIKTPLIRDKNVNENVCTPGMLLNSIKKIAKLKGSHTPPLKVMNEFVQMKKNKTARDTSIAMAGGSKENPVSKRMGKCKDLKKVIRKGRKINSPKNDKIDHLLATLVNRTPQTTPKAVKEIFRSNEDGSDASDFGSDVSSISP
ncbi:hypothetical protein O3M35_012372 [Rhynocoris fuscipes]